MANQKIETTPSTTAGLTKTDRTGFLPSVVHLALDVADRSQTTAFAVLQDARIEVRTAVDSGLDLAEKLAAAVFRFTRKGVQRVDDATSETLTGVSVVIANGIKGARETTRVATELATTATAGVTGQAAA